jgi:hypothetical protein
MAKDVQLNHQNIRLRRFSGEVFAVRRRPVPLSFQGREFIEVGVVALQCLDLATVDPLRRSNSPHVPGEVRMPAQK